MVDVFDRAVVALSPRVAEPERQRLSLLLHNHGAIVVRNLNARITVAVCEKADVWLADVTGVPHVLPAWVDASVAAGSARPCASFSVAILPAVAVSSGAIYVTPAAVAGGSGSGLKHALQQSDDDDDDEEKKPASKPSVSKSAKLMKVVKKGKAPVDAHCGHAATAHVLEEGDTVYDCMLNQTNIGQNNNKFYIVQLLESDSGGSYFTWNRWGRVGATGQSKLEPCGSNLASAKSNFKKKFKEKTGNDWDNRKHFVSHKGKYTLIDINYGSDEDVAPAAESVAEKNKKLAKIPDSTLAKPLQDLIQLICNVKMMEKALVQLEFDIEKMPLGKLKKSTIEKASAVLKKIETVLKGGAGSKSSLNELSSEFYTLVPHAFGMKVPPPISSLPHLLQKVELLQTLGDVEIAQSLLKAADASGTIENPIDSHYKKLRCGLKPLDHASSVFQLLSTYTTQSHGPTHTNYHLQVLDIFEVVREGEEQRAAKYKSMDNRMLLWHGSRLTNWMGILSQGLRIAPPEAPVTGYMFGKGLYFADVSSKSANYCCTSSDNSTGIMVLSEVALGKMYDCYAAEYMDKPKAGFDSTRGLGRMYPNPHDTVTLPDGVKVPLGSCVNQTINNGGGYTALQYNEFIVYDVAQATIRYLLKLKFNYKK